MALKADSVVDTVNPFFEKIAGFMLTNPTGPPEVWAEGLALVEENVIPEFMNYILPELTMSATGEVCGVCSCDELCLADFWAGGMYTNGFNNPMNMMGMVDPEFNWRVLEDYPKFNEYGEWFSAKMADYLLQRGPAAF